MDGVTYYLYETVKPRNLIAAAVTDGQLYVINAAAANDRQWAAGEAFLRAIVDCRARLRDARCSAFKVRGAPSKRTRCGIRHHVRSA